MSGVLHTARISTAELIMSSDKPAWCSGGHGFYSCRGLGFFFLPRSCHVESVHLSHLITELKIHHLHITTSYLLIFSFIIRFCLIRTGNYQIHEFDWLKRILTAV